MQDYRKFSGIEGISYGNQQINKRNMKNRIHQIDRTKRPEKAYGGILVNGSDIEKNLPEKIPTFNGLERHLSVGSKRSIECPVIINLADPESR